MSANLPALGSKADGFVGIDRYVPVLEGVLNTPHHKKFFDDAVARLKAIDPSGPRGSASRGGRVLPLDLGPVAERLLQAHAREPYGVDDDRPLVQARDELGAEGQPQQGRPDGADRHQQTHTQLAARQPPQRTRLARSDHHEIGLLLLRDPPQRPGGRDVDDDLRVRVRRQLVVGGWTVLRFTWEQVMFSPWEVVAAVRHFYGR